MNKAQLAGIRIEAQKKDDRETEIAWEKTVKDGDYTVHELRGAFDRVQDKTNWKNPIDAVILTKDQDITRAAIIHYTGSAPSFGRIDGNNLRVLAAGYYIAIGA